MRKIVAICSLEMKRTFKRRSSYIIMFAMPLIFTLLFGGLFGENAGSAMPIAIVDEDGSVYSQHLIRQLKSHPFTEYEEVDAATAKELLSEKSVEGVVTIKKDFLGHIAKEEPAVMLQHPPGTAAAPMLEQLYNQAIRTLDLQVTAAQIGASYENKEWDMVFEQLIETESGTNGISEIHMNDAQVESWNKMSYSSAGFSIMFVMIVMLFTTGTLIEARNMGIWSRLLTTPATRIQLTLGYVLSFFIIGFVQFTLLIVLTSLLFGVQWGDPLGLAILVTVLLFSVVGLGMAIATLVKTSEQQSAVGMLLIISTSMLGGVYWPLDIVPEFMQKIANFVPQSWAIEGFKSLVDGAALGDIMTPILVLMGFAIVFLSIGISRVRYQ
ncbi:putative transport permease YfiN [Sporosarcina sp. NCCP-2222]|uniref:ABC transporter permease n=1 Tax=Sporosarcina sp. NCCP-2222 TaxID=2935073 RepID=UPI00208C668F|nr:ABC transporter permease [Sporosarcina sp. NCCP-2222]GKV57836.1 putative transport permease YfiN [Sporosarcina sp. NCCP-2222]